MLNLAEVPYVDSAGLGEIVRTYTTVSRQGGSLKLLNLTKRITDLLSITKLLTVFETFDVGERRGPEFFGIGQGLAVTRARWRASLRLHGSLRRSGDHGAGRSRRLQPALISLRPGQWTKNLLVFAGLLFGKRLFDPGCGRATRSAAFAMSSARCPASSTSSTTSSDRDSDRQHPLKAQRPIASGALPGARRARRGGCADGGGRWSRGASASARRSAAGGRATLALQVLYSGPLKHIVIIDVLTIAIGFVLRAVAGAVAIDVADQPLAARLHDPAGAVHRAGQAAARTGAAGRRRRRGIGRFCGEYSPYLLDQMIAVVTASTLDRLHLLHDQSGDRAEVRHRSGSG